MHESMSPSRPLAFQVTYISCILQVRQCVCHFEQVMIMAVCHFLKTSEWSPTPLCKLVSISSGGIANQSHYYNVSGTLFSLSGSGLKLGVFSELTRWRVDKPLPDNFRHLDQLDLEQLDQVLQTVEIHRNSLRANLLLLDHYHRRCLFD